MEITEIGVKFPKMSNLSKFISIKLPNEGSQGSQGNQRCSNCSYSRFGENSKKLICSNQRVRDSLYMEVIEFNNKFIDKHYRSMFIGIVPLVDETFLCAEYNRE